MNESAGPSGHVNVRQAPEQAPLAVGPSKLRRLPGRGAPLMRSMVTSERQRLYLGPEFLVVVRTNYAEETHKKFYFSDIQAITVQTNSERAILGSIWFILTIGLVAAAVLIETLWAESEGAGIVVFGVLAVFPGLMFLWTLLMGPRCTTRLHTAVQVVELTCLRRVRVARKSLSLLVPLIQQAQGEWPGELSTPDAFAGQSLRASANRTGLEGRSKSKVVTGGVHRLAFFLTLLLGLSQLADMLYMHGAKNIFDLVLFLVASTALLVALVRQLESTIPRFAKYLTWAPLFVNGSVFIVFFVVGIFDALEQDPETMVDPFAMRRYYFSEEPLFEQIFAVIFGVANLILGGLGLAAMRGYRVVGPAEPETTDEGDSPSS